MVVVGSAVDAAAEASMEAVGAVVSAVDADSMGAVGFSIATADVVIFTPYNSISSNRLFLKLSSFYFSKIPPHQ